MLTNTDDLRIKQLKPLIPPAILIEELPVPAATSDLITQARQEAADIIAGKDQRLLVIIGPCSIHDTNAALEYADKLAQLRQQLADKLCIVMRVYFEKPRTRVGWKGLINDPDLDGQFRINHGLRVARKLLVDINTRGLPAATEFLDTIIPQYLSDLITWGAIGARTTESQIHRELASGLSMPIGFKNGTTGNTAIAIDAIAAASHSHHFLGVTKHGIPAIIETDGNPSCHIILRGSHLGPNYQPEFIKEVSAALTKSQLTPRVMVDCSHGNSNKDHRQQATVVKNICQQLKNGSKNICGVMLESHLTEGNQPLTDKKALTYGQSITDACIGWDESVTLLHELAEAVS